MLSFKFINILGVFILLAILVLIGFEILPMYLVLFVFVGWLLLTFLGSVNIQWNYFLTSFNKKKLTSERAVAITFDDGPTENTLEILKTLRQFDAKATFFCVGHKIDAHPTIFQKIISEGHQVGNHTYSHSPLTGFMSTRQVEQEIQKCDLVAKTCANLNLKLFRPPSGVTNPNLKKALARTGHSCIGWSKRSFDTILRSEEKILKRITQKLTPGDVVLLHDTQPHSVAILEQLLLFLQKKDIKTQTIGLLFKIDAYN